ncbi:MAG: DHH family phosphoesterase [Flavobacteriales bacterium]
MINPIFKKTEVESLFEHLSKAETILIFGHKNPDGDSIGSTLALHHFLKTKRINSQVIQPDGFPNFLKWMEGTEDILLFEKQPDKVTELINKAEVIFNLDYNDQSRVGKELGQLLGQSDATKVMIDHHQQPDDFAQFTFSDVNSCSTAQLVYEFIEANGDLGLINETIGNCIYTGILTDTGSFRFPSVTPKTHLIAADLISRGVVHSNIHEKIYDINTPERLKLLGYTLNNKLEVLPEINTAIISLTKEEMLAHNTQKGYTEGFVNAALSILGINIAVFVKEDNHIVKISFRSKGDIHVNEFSKQHFGGGGHINAAGGASNLSVEETVNKIKKELPTFLEQNK